MVVAAMPCANNSLCGLVMDKPSQVLRASCLLSCVHVVHLVCDVAGWCISMNYRDPFPLRSPRVKLTESPKFGGK
jgi:hypothetical protein